MSHQSQTLSQKIKLIEKSTTPENMEYISTELSSLDENIFDKENKDDEDNKINILVKFEDEITKEEISKYINDKIFSINNDERLAFTEYFQEINNEINKGNEEDF